MKKIVMITGATAGFGEATAHEFAKNGYDLILTGRRADRLNKVAEELGGKYGVEVFTLNFDVRNNAETQKSIYSLPAQWQNIDVLVNNAGLASGFGPIQDGNIEDWEKMIDTNVKGLLYVTRCIAPMMIKNQKGHIINIGSTAGKEAYLNGNVYCATKFAVDALTKSMRIDMLPHGIRVTSVCPGMAETEFSLVRFHGDAEKAKNVYNGLVPLSARDIADVIYFVASRPANVNISDVVVTPLAQANTSNIIRK
ncbi:MAG TPA: SDR family oxidoreductase [Bacteroidia bacterium]|nr:SDR family oxidoreductase [Bacteroidia bacterium]